MILSIGTENYLFKISLSVIQTLWKLGMEKKNLARLSLLKTKESEKAIIAVVLKVVNTDKPIF